MDNIFKQGNYLKLKGDSTIFQVIVENPTEEDWEKYLHNNPHRYPLFDKVILMVLDNNRYGWDLKGKDCYELVNYMNTPLWKALNG